jgi:acetolactate synthase-1/2/3 large subunit
MRAADVIVKCLEAHGVRRVFVVPGESFLSVLDALHGSSIDIIVCRHESGAGFMAVAEAKLTGRPAVALVSRGPGATNASIAVHVAEQDAVPLLLLVGQVSREERTRGAFQEVDYRQFFGGMAKAVHELTDGAKAAELFARSFLQATSGTPGPVVLSLPEDAQDDEVEDAIPQPYPRPAVHHAPADAERLQTMLDAAERPLLIAGASFRGARQAAVLQRFAEAQRLPVAVTWKNQDVFDNGSQLYAGHLGFGNPPSHRELLAQADLIVAAGTRLGDIASLNYQLPRAPVPAQPLVHIYPDAKPIGQVFFTDLGIVADPVAMFAALAGKPRVVSSAREAWCSSLNAYIRQSQEFASVNPTDGVDFGSVTVSIARQAPDAIVTTDAGNMSSWIHRYWVMTPRNTMLGAIAGAMGFGVPAAVAAAIEQPERTILCFVGDGGILMTGQEIATAVACGAKPKIVLSDNGIYGTIRTHQERHFPGRVSGTSLVNPDFTVWAKSFGIAAFTLALGDDIDASVRAFLDHDGAALLHVRSSRQALSAFGTLRET